MVLGLGGAPTGSQANTILRRRTFPSWAIYVLRGAVIAYWRTYGIMEQVSGYNSIEFCLFLSFFGALCDVEFFLRTRVFGTVPDSGLSRATVGISRIVCCVLNGGG